MQLPILVALLLLKWAFARPSSPEKTSLNVSSLADANGLLRYGNSSSSLDRNLSLITNRIIPNSDERLVNGSKIAGLIEAGKAVFITGQAIVPDQFSFNFYEGEPKVGGEIVFHCSVRFPQNEIVLNSLTGGHWQEETKGPLPFGKGEWFTIAILFKDTTIDVYASGPQTNQNKFVNSHKQVLPISSITHFNVHGNIKVKHVKVTGKMVPTPFKFEFASELAVHQGVLIYAFTYQELDTFEINLMDSQSNTALHVRYRSDIDKIIGNTRRHNGEWMEQFERPNPFVPGGLYEIIIGHNQRSFDIVVNGREALNVPKQFFDPIKYITIWNNIIVSEVVVIPY